MPEWYEVENWIITWAPIIFMGLLVFFIWRTLKLMPRTKPQQIKPESASAITWEEVAGADEAKAELAEVVEFLRDPKRFAALGAQVPKGILLHGPPGTGKTLLAKAVAHESGAQFFSQSAASFVEMFAGLGAARIRRLFAEARKERPAIIFIDGSTPSAPAAGPTTTRSASRRSTSSSSRWTGSTRPATSSSSPRPTCSRSSTRRCCARAGSTARSSSPRPASPAARRS